MASPAARQGTAKAATRRTFRTARRSLARVTTAPARRSRGKFLRYYPGGFKDPDYLDLERGYKWTAHERWIKALGEAKFCALIRSGNYASIARLAVAIESRPNLLFSFEKMALRDAVKSNAGADIRDLRPRDMIDLQSFIWVQGSDEYPD